MRNRSLLLAAAAAAPLLTGLGLAVAAHAPAPAVAAAPTVASDDYAVDAAHSHVLFRTTHLGLSYAHGRFDRMSGSFRLGDTPKIEMEIDLTSVDTQNEKRDAHLKGPDFFNTAEFPKATFRSTAVEKKGEDTWRVTGQFELLGKKREVAFDATKIGEGKDPWEGYRAGLHAEFTIKRSDFGMNWGIENDSVGDEVLIEVSLEGIRE